MKSWMWIGILWLMIFLSTLAAGEDQIPAPFAKAKELALNAGLDQEYRRFYMWKTEFGENGEKIVYQINYWEGNFQFPDQIVLIKIVGGISAAICYAIEEKKFKRFSYNSGWFDIREKEALEFAFQFFRGLVSKGLI